MNPTLSIDHATGTTLDVDGSPITLRLPAGSAIFAVGGEAWITQERVTEDIILGAGQRFDVRTRDPLVIRATRGRAVLFVARPAVARRYRERTVVDFVRSDAAARRRDEAARVVDTLIARTRALLQRVHSAFASRPRVTTH